MNATEFKAIVDDAVKAGADRKDAEAYVRAGYKLPAVESGKRKAESAKPKAPKKKKPMMR
jgi:hypothetical protein